MEINKKLEGLPGCAVLREAWETILFVTIHNFQQISHE